jgi:hemoglobin
MSWGDLRFVLAFLAFPPVGSNTSQAQDKPAETIKTADLDKQIYDLLRTVINTGADLYNREADRPGCYRVYQGCLLTLRPLLGHHPDLQKEIDSAFADADRMPDAAGRAFRLRYALNMMRQKFDPKGATKGSVERKPVVSEIPPKGARSSDLGKVELPRSTLWLRLGGETGVRRLVDDWISLAVKDAKVNFSRDGKFKFTDAQLAELKAKLVAQISQATEGPISYTGKGMKEVHQGMGITNAEFDALIADLKETMAGRRGMKETEIQDLVSKIEATRKDIIQPAKPEPKKTGKI